MANSSTEQDLYGLPRDATETWRLNEQHAFLTKVFTFLVHPSISMNAESLRVADVSCGSGVWLTDVARHYPYTKCDGFDISSSQFPRAEELQSTFGHRVNFHVRDAADASGPGNEFVGVFDVVAVRLMHINIVGDQWERAVRNAVSMLSESTSSLMIAFIP